MIVLLNGESRTLDPNCSVSQLLDLEQLTQRRVAVEINGDIIPRSEHPTTLLREGDRIEIVHALGGG